MNLQDFVETILSWSILLPAALLCLAPMRNCLKKSFAVTLRNMLLFLALLVIATAALESLLPSYFNALTPFVLATSFIAYHNSLTIDITKSLAVFFLVIALMGFFTNVSVLYDARRFPDSNLNHFSSDANLFQFVFSTLMCALLFYPLYKYGSRLIDRFNIRRVWIATLPMLSIFITYNLLTLPQKYETMHVNNVFLAACVSMGLLFLLMILLCVIFYFIVDGLIAASETRERNQFLEMQESHYLAVQRYMDETARVRHDFKHTIGALSDLATSGDLDAVRKYLDEYLESQPHADAKHYCSDTAVNALLNHYMHRALEQKIEVDMEIGLPAEQLQIASVDLCSILGNILENAIIACGNVPTPDRYIDLLVRNDHGSIYLIASNSFDGNVRVKDGRYISTHRHGHGIGLSSITSTAKKYGGTVRFSHEDGEFRTDVVLPNTNPNP